MPSGPDIHRGYSALRRWRCSIDGATYFLTGCLARPLIGLTDDPVATIVQTRLREIEQGGHWRLRSSVLMPDHFHLLVTLSAQTPLPDVIRLFKGPLAPEFRKRGLQWQKNFYDHRLRPDDKLSQTLLYIFLNPYKAGLIKTDQKWPWYTCCSEDWSWFGGMTNDSLPFPEWIR